MKETQIINIGFDAKRAFLNKSGLGNYSRDIIRNFQHFYPQNNYFLFTPRPHTDLLEQQYTRRTISPNLFTGLLKAYWRSYTLTHLLNKNKIDIYHGLSNELPFNIKKTKAKKVVSIHDVIFLKYPHLYKRIDRLFYYKKTLSACNNADKIIAISTQTKHDIIKYFNVDEKRIEVQYQSCAVSFERDIKDEEKDSLKIKYNLPDNFILNVGTIEPRKNVLSVLKALIQFKIDVPLVVVGRATPYLKEIQEFALLHKMAHNLLVLENVTNDELPVIYSMSSLFIYPSLYEGFGIPILEAFNSGVPVITSDTGSMAEVAGDAAIKVSPLNIEQMGLEIERLLKDDSLKSELVNAGKERAVLFNASSITEKLMSVYLSIL